MPLILVVTDAGRQALINAEQNGTDAVRVATCGVSATAVVPARGATTLPGEIKRIGTLSGGAAAADVLHLVVRDETADSYTLRSFALYLDDGTLFAIYGQPDAILEKSSQALMLLQTDVQLADIAATQVTFGDANWLNPPATTETAGVVELSTDVEAAALVERRRVLTPANLGAVFTGANILTRLSQVDGAGSGLDADTVDGRHASELMADRGSIPVALINSATANGSYSVNHGTFSDSMLVWDQASSTGTVQISFNFMGGAQWRNRQDGALWSGWRTIWNSANDGAGSGLDADLLDGREGAYYTDIAGRLGYRPVQTGGGSGQLSNEVRIGWSGSRLLATVDQTNQGPFVFDNHISDVWRVSNDGAGSGLDADMVDGLQGGDIMANRGQLNANQIDGATANGFYAIHYPGYSDSVLVFDRASSTGTVQIAFNFRGDMQWRNRIDGSLWAGWRTIWNSANDGAGSGLDADLLDGREGAYYTDIVGRLGYRPVQTGGGSGQLSNEVRIGWSGARLLAMVDQTNQGPFVFDNHISDVWRVSNDGAGSGLDADMVDGLQGADIMANRGQLNAEQIDSATANGFYAVHHPGYSDSVLVFDRASSTGTVQVSFNYLGNMHWRNRQDGALWSGWRTIWNSANDGAGSGLDADLLDGWQRDDVRQWDNLLGKPGSFPPSGHTHGAADIAGAFASRSFGADGYQVLPGGLILQWMSGAQNPPGSESTQGITYPIGFPNAVLRVFVSTQIGSATTRSDAMYQLVGSPNLGNCVVQRQRFAEDDATSATPHIFAIGY